MTKEEKHLWYDFLKKLPLTVNRQKNIGDYIVDFFIAKNRIVIEIDGSQHGMSENLKVDEKRDRELGFLGNSFVSLMNILRHFYLLILFSVKQTLCRNFYFDYRNDEFKKPSPAGKVDCRKARRMRRSIPFF